MAVTVCATCGSSDVQISAWINPNTGKIIDDEGPVDYGWCTKCDVEVNTVTREGFADLPEEKRKTIEEKEEALREMTRGLDGIVRGSFDLPGAERISRELHKEQREEELRALFEYVPQELFEEPRCSFVLFAEMRRGVPWHS